MTKLELLVSPPGTGKTTYCIDLFRDQISSSRAGLDSRCYFVLPSREHADRVQNLVLKKDMPGLFNAHIISINDLAPALLPGTGLAYPNDAIRRAILRRILISGRPPLHYFETVKDLHGFHDLLCDTVKEFSSNLIGMEEIEKMAQPLLKNPVFRSKFRDFSVVFKNYVLELERLGLEEPEESIRRLERGEGVSQKPQIVIFDGFYHFTRAQKSLIRLVSRSAERVVVTLTLPRRPAENELLFEYPERTREFLRKEGFRESPDKFKKSHRVGDPALQHLEENIFLPQARIFEGDASSIGIIEAPGARIEVELIARKIRQLYRENSYHFSDMCLIFRSVGSYEKIIRSVFAELEVPVHIHERYQLAHNGFVQTLYRFFELTLQGWKREDLIFAMKSCFFRKMIGLDEALNFESASLRGNISSGRENWLKLADSATVPPTAASFVRFLASWEDLFLTATSVRHFSRLVEEFTGHFDAGVPLGESVIEDFEALSSLRAILQASRKYYESAQDIRLFAASDFLSELQESIESGLFSVKPRAKNCVQVYDAIMAIPKEFKVVFIAGLLEKSFPKSVSEDPLFKDRERRVINRDQVLMEERLWRIGGERYFFYMALTRAREKLFMSYSAYDLQARPTLPSFFLDETARCFKPGSIARIRRTLDDFLPAADQLETISDATRAVSEAFFSGASSAVSVRSAAAGLYNIYLNRPDWRMVVSYGLASGQAMITGVKTLAEFELLENDFSATRLETYAACAFHYFSARILKLNKPVGGNEALEMGKMMHSALDEYYKSLTTDQRKGGKYLEDPQTMQGALWEHLDGQLKRGPFRNEPFYRQRIYQTQMKETLAKFVAHEIVLAGSRNFVPAYFELGFGESVKGQLSYLKLASPKTAILIGGKIDRVDLSADGKSALIIDYKRSRKNLGKKLEKKLELQLPLYMLAVEKLLGLRVAGAEHRILTEAKKEGIYHEDFAEIMGASKSQTRSEEELRVLLSETQAQVLSLVKRLRGADISVKSKSCEFCEFDPVCRFEKWKLIYESGVAASVSREIKQ